MDPKPPDSPKLRFWNYISTNSLVQFLLFFASGWAVIQIFHYFENVIFIFAAASILALLLNYPVRYLEKFLVRGYALGIVIFLCLIIVSVLFLLIGITITSQLQGLLNTVPQILETLERSLHYIELFLERRRGFQVDLTPLYTQIQNLITSIASLLVGSVPSFFGNFINFIFVIVIAFYMVVEGEKLWRLVLKLIPPQHRQRFDEAVRKNFTGFLRGQLLISIFLGCATALVLLLLQIPNAIALGIIIGAFDLIPGIGATLGVSIISLTVLLQSGLVSAIYVAITSIILQQFQDNLIAPRILQSAVNLNPVILFFSLLVGTKVAGLVGLLLSVPIAATLVSLLDIEEMQSSAKEVLNNEKNNV